MKIYLAGPLPTQKNWRKKLINLVNDPTIKWYDPADFENTFSDATIVNYDKSIIKNCNLVVANITRLSAGTSMEILFAFENHIPVLLIGDKKLLGPWHRHHSSFIVNSLEDAPSIIQKFYKHQLDW